MSESVRIFFACALGAFFGGLLGLELSSFNAWLWLPSALVGGVIGWITYDVRTLGAAIARAWREVIGWRPDKVWWRKTVRKAIHTLTGWAYIVLLAETWVLLGLFLYLFCLEYPAAAPAIFVLYIFLVSGVLGAAVTFLDEDDLIRFICLLANPVVLPIAVVGAAGWGSITYRRQIGSGCKLFGRFCKRAVILAHSDLRLLCLVDATIGAVAGYFLGSALLGALIGGASGLVNYWVVAIKILHLAPVRARNE